MTTEIALTMWVPVEDVRAAIDERRAWSRHLNVKLEALSVRATMSKQTGAWPSAERARTVKP